MGHDEPGFELALRPVFWSHKLGCRTLIRSSKFAWLVHIIQSNWDQ